MPQSHGFQEYYRYDAEELRRLCPHPVYVVETDVDLYYRIALDLYDFALQCREEGRPAAVILPVGPVFQYRRFRDLLDRRPLDLSHLTCFFMDEYLDADMRLIAAGHPLSFRGFIEREFAGPLEKAGLLRDEQVRFPDPAEPERYDEEIAGLGGAGLCQAGVGINGHLAFNEACRTDEAGRPSMTVEEFSTLPTRVLELSPETRITNSHTALAGAFEHIPTHAVTVGMSSILSSGKIRVYLNRQWQRTVFRKALCEEPTAAFPVTLVQGHRDAAFTVTGEVAAVPQFMLA